VSDGISTVLLQAEAAPGGTDMSFFIMMGAIFMIFYFLVMRPQQKQQRSREAAIKSAAKGDRIVTSGGIHGVISDVKEDSVTVEIARVKGGARVEVEVARTGLASVSKPGIVEAGDDDQKKGGDGS
jgi:preprotein translocase subunit YajC